MTKAKSKSRKSTVKATAVKGSVRGSENIATEAVVRSFPDGYTILLVTGTNAINNTLYEKLSFNFNRDIASVAGISRVPELMVANLSVPAKTVPEFIAYAKANPSKLNMASGGIGTPSHMAGELFKMKTGVDMVHVPYRGVAPALTDLISGQVQVMFAASGSSIGHIKAGRLRALTGRSSELKVSLAARQCQRLRPTKVSIRSRSSACSRLVSTERPHRNLTVKRIR